MTKGKWALIAAGFAGLVCAAPAWAQDNFEGAVDPGVVEEAPVDDPNAMPEDINGDPNAAPEEVPQEEMAPPPPVMPTPVRQQQPQARPVRRPIERLQGRGRPTPPPGGQTPPGPRGNAQAGGQPVTRAPGTNGIEPGETPEDAATFNYNGTDILDVVKAIARLTGKNFDVDPSVGNIQVTLITHDEIPPEMAMQVLESVLASRGFRMVETMEGKLIKILPDPNARRSEKTPLFTGSELPDDGYEGISTHIVQIKYANPEELREILQQLGSEQSKIDAYLPTNTLIITDTADGIRRIFSFLEVADIPGSDTDMEIFTLEYTRAEVLAQQLQQVLLDQAQPGQPQQGNRPARQVETQNVRRPTRPIPGGVDSQVVGSNEEVLRTVADERLNSLIVLATPGMMERVRDLVKRLDTPTPYESNNLHVYELLNADAEMVEQALQPLLGSAPRSSGGGGAGAAGGGAAGGGAGAAGGGGGSVANSNIQPFEREVQVTRYDQTNSLLVVASPQDYKVLEAFIARLDVPQRQVNVLCTVMDVTITDDYSVGVDAAGITGNSGFGLTSTSRLLSVATAANDIVGGEVTDPANAASSIALSLLSLGTGGGLTAGIFDDIEVEVGGREVKIPFVPVLFQAIETITDLEVLSLPNVTTVDNEEASVTVGQEVPFVTNQRRAVDTDDNQNNNFNFNNFNSIRREDVGVKLTVTPQISEGDNVLLEISLEISEVAPASQQIGDVNLLGPTTNKSLVENKVLVKDGSTAVLAGLLRDTTSRNRTQAPVLGDVPVLGLLFRGRDTNQRKQNLVALVTPSIVKDNVDLERITHFTVDEYQKANIEEFFAQGFFEKIKNKRSDRKKHRPAQEHAEEVLGQNVGPGDEKYGRGDIKR